MLEITLDVSKLVETLNSMEAQLKNFPTDMGQELTDWQTEDMNRRYPNTTVDETSASTEIWPTSRLNDQKRIVAALRSRGKKVAQPVARVKGAGSQRPILREELYEKLVTRMDKLMSEKLSWR
jgi:hypothetical protein